MTQEQALDILKTGGNVFLTGEPGAGKTHTLNRYIEYLKDHKIRVAVTASTGIAATHIGGMTIHAWSGIGIKDALSPQELDAITQRERIVKRVNNTHVLVIDEISMLDGSILGMVEEVVRTIKGVPLPFGGMQVVLVGDFFQLPPVKRRGEVLQFAFDASLWHKLDPLVCYISEQYRQDDVTLGSLLSSIRSGEVDESISELLESCSETSFREGIEPTKLYTHNADVDTMNAKRLTELHDTSHTFDTVSRGAAQLVEGLKRSCLSPERLELKEGAMVMCTKNNFEAGYVNGTLGQVIGFDEKKGYPIVETFDGKEITIAPATWSVMDGEKALAEVTQIPLRLAWAITVHKSQGMSLDAAEMNLQNAFEYGQGYVALSRVRSLKGLLLRGCNARALEVHPQVLARDREFQERSKAASETFGEMESAELNKMHEQFITAHGGVLKADRSWKEAVTEQKKSTFEQTHDLLLAGKTIAEITTARGLKQGTVIEHIEKLLRDGALTRAQIGHLMPQDEAGKRMFADIQETFRKVGMERLKPVHTAHKGQYSYEEIRLVRALTADT